MATDPSKDDVGAAGEPNADDAGGLESGPEAEAEETAPEPAAAEVDSGPHSGHIWWILAAFLVMIGLLAVIVATDAWHPFACESNDDCRGLRECFEGRCVSPEVWERARGQ